MDGKNYYYKLVWIKIYACIIRFNIQIIIFFNSVKFLDNSVIVMHDFDFNIEE